MKSPTHLLVICGLALLITASGCVQNQNPRYVRGSYRAVPRSPYIGSPEWITWVDHKVDTRYANGNRPDPGSQEWYAIVDHVVFSDFQKDYYRGVYRDQYREDYRRNFGTEPGYGNSRNYASNYTGPAQFDSRGGSYRRDGKRYRIGTVEWKRAVDAEILSGRVPPPPPRSDPWDTPLVPTSDR